MQFALPLVLAICLAASPAHAQTATAPAAATVPTPVNDEPITPPTIVYPADAKQKHIQGVVELEVRVSDTGRVTSVRALSGPEELRQAAIDAYSLASYQPLLRQGKPIPAIIKTKVDFSLHEAPPSPDDFVAREFEPVHTQCETLFRTKDPGALDTCQQALQIAKKFSPASHAVARATSYNDLAVVLLSLNKPKEAAAIGDEAVVAVADAYPGSLAAAIAYITRAETTSHTGDLHRSITDCVNAETILRGLLAQERAPSLDDDIRTQLKGVLRLHAVLLRKNHQGYKAKPLEEEADRLNSTV